MEVHEKHSPVHFILMRLALCDTGYREQAVIAKLPTTFPGQDIQGNTQFRQEFWTLFVGNVTRIGRLWART